MNLATPCRIGLPHEMQDELGRGVFPGTSGWAGGGDGCGWVEWEEQCQALLW